MTTLAQCIYKTAHPNMSHDFENNEHFEEFRDGLLNVAGMSAEKLDTVMIDIPNSSKPKDDKLTPATIQRRSHNVVRDALNRKKLSLLNIVRFLLNKLYHYSQQLKEEVDEELVQKWETQIDVALKKLDNKSAFETLLGVFAKVLTLSPTGKTMLTYLGARKKNEVKEDDIEETDDSDNSSFQIPK